MPGNLIRALHLAPRSSAGGSWLGRSWLGRTWLGRTWMSRLIPSILPVLLISACAAPLFARMPGAQKHEFRHEIDQLEDTWRAAVLKGDTKTVSSLLADDYMAITPSGTLQTKEESLNSLRSGGMRFTSLDISDRKVRFYGDTAVVTSLADVQGTTSEGALSGSYRYTRVYVRDAQGAWKIVSFEASRIIGPVAHK
ncbi:MAG: nuclear transport factor 2 family protein [Terracidiphilus sp.]|jgi:ketosteroid isomerase-like protein